MINFPFSQKTQPNIYQQKYFLSQFSQHLVIIPDNIISPNMLIKSEVDRRIDTLSKYVVDLKDKVYGQRYTQAKNLLKKQKKSINDNYISPYNPNVFVIDSLKAKREKLCKEIMRVQEKLKEKKEMYEMKQQKKGYTTYGINNEEQFVAKLQTKQVGLYISRFPITLQDSNKLEYENAELETDFNFIKVTIEDNESLTLPYQQIKSHELSIFHILLCFKHGETGKQNYMMLKYNDDNEKEKWSRTIKFCMIIHQTKQKKYLFLPQQAHEQNDGLPQIKYDKLERYQKAQKSKQKERERDISRSKIDQSDSILQHSSSFFKKDKNKGTYSAAHKKGVLDLNRNKSPALDRMRRQSENVKYDTLKSPNLVERYRNSKERKISQDLTYQNENHMFRFKSQKTFENESKNPNSHSSQEIGMKKKTQTAVAEKPRSKEKEVDNHSFTKKVSHALLNESSIRWIQEQEDENEPNLEQKRVTNRGHDYQLNITNKHHESYKEEELQSPVFPFNLREKKEQKQKRNILNLQPVQNEEKEEEEEVEEERQVSEEEDEFENNQGIQINIHEVKKENEIREEEEKEEDDEEENNDIVNGVTEDQHESEADSVGLGAQVLKEGLQLDKCAEGGWSAHRKRLYLSENEIEICWVNTDGSDGKKIRLSDVASINYAQYGKGIAKHIKKIEKARCMMIRYYKDNSTKDMEFILPDTSDSKEKLRDFAQKLQNYVEYKKKSK